MISLGWTVVDPMCLDSMFFTFWCVEPSTVAGWSDCLKGTDKVYVLAPGVETRSRLAVHDVTVSSLF